MKEVKAFRCDFCGKLYLRKSACLKHEENRCTRNPKLRPLCLDCKHYRENIDKYDIEEISYSVDSPFGEEERNILFNPNKCDVTDCKLYYNIKLTDDLTTALDEAGYKPMPLPEDGCTDFEPIS